MKNEYEVLGETTVIFIKMRNGIILSTYIDTSDLDKVKGHKGSWYANYHKRSGTYYVMSNFRKRDGKYTLIGLHRYLMDLPQGKVVDHIDRNPLNNKKGNLRVVTQAENNQNKRLQKNNKAGVRGVYWCTHRNVWRAYVKHQGKNHYFGNHTSLKSAEEAAIEGRRKLLPYANE